MVRGWQADESTPQKSDDSSTWGTEATKSMLASQSVSLGDRTVPLTWSHCPSATIPASQESYCHSPCLKSTCSHCHSRCPRSTQSHRHGTGHTVTIPVTLKYISHTVTIAVLEAHTVSQLHYPEAHTVMLSQSRSQKHIWFHCHNHCPRAHIIPCPSHRSPEAQAAHIAKAGSASRTPTAGANPGQ